MDAYEGADRGRRGVFGLGMDCRGRPRADNLRGRRLRARLRRARADDERADLRLPADRAGRRRAAHGHHRAGPKPAGQAPGSGQAQARRGAHEPADPRAGREPDPVAVFGRARDGRHGDRAPARAAAPTPALPRHLLGRLRARARLRRRRDPPHHSARVPHPLRRPRRAVGGGWPGADRRAPQRPLSGRLAVLGGAARLRILKARGRRDVQSARRPAARLVPVAVAVRVAARHPDRGHARRRCQADRVRAAVSRSRARTGRSYSASASVVAGLTAPRSASTPATAN